MGEVVDITKNKWCMSDVLRTALGRIETGELDDSMSCVLIVEGKGTFEVSLANLNEIELLGLISLATQVVAANDD